MKEKDVSPKTNAMLAKLRSLISAKGTGLTDEQATSANVSFGRTLNKFSTSFDVVIKTNMDNLISQAAVGSEEQAALLLAQSGKLDQVIEQFRNGDEVANKDAAELINAMEVLSSNFLDGSKSQEASLTDITKVLTTQVEDTRLSENERLDTMKQTLEVLLQSNGVSDETRVAIVKMLNSGMKLDKESLLKFEKVVTVSTNTPAAQQETLDLRDLNAGLDRNFASSDELFAQLQKDELKKRVTENAASVSSGQGEVQQGLVQSLVGAFGITGAVGDKLSGFLNDKIATLMEKPAQAFNESISSFTVGLSDKAKSVSSSVKEFFLPTKKDKVDQLKKEAKVDRKLDVKERKKKAKQALKDNKILTTEVTSNISSKMQDITEATFQPVAETMQDQFTSVTKHMEKTLKKVKGGGLGKGLLLGRLLQSAVAGGIAGGIATGGIGAALVTAAGVIGPMLAVAVAGAFGLWLGNEANKKLDRLVEELTDGDSKNVGEGFFNTFHKTDRQKGNETTAALTKKKESSLVKRGFTPKEARHIALAKNYSVISRQGPEAFRAGTTKAITFSTSTAAIAKKVEGNKNLSGQSAFEPIIQKASQTYGVPAEMIRSIIQQESNFNPKARSSAGALGLMQLMPATAKELGVTDPFDPEQSIMAGTSYYKKQLDRFGDPQLALAAYNAGPRHISELIKQYGNDPATVLQHLSEKTGKHSKETRNYVSKISAFNEVQGNDITTPRPTKVSVAESPSASVASADAAFSGSVDLNRKAASTTTKTQPVIVSAGKKDSPEKPVEVSRVTRIDDTGILLANTMLYQ